LTAAIVVDDLTVGGDRARPPLTYAYDALAAIASHGPYDACFALDVAVIVGGTLAALALAAATLRRRTP
jgi:hypothetical protein